jgi:predicted dehydrogenase
MKVLILGLGSIGRRHARCFKTVGADIVAGFDPDAERRSQFVQEIGGTAFATETESLAWNPDVVVVASPNAFHIRQARLAAAAGKAMLIEKPLGTDLAEARELGAAIDAAGIYAHVGSNWKFHPAFKTMKTWIAQKRLGVITGVQVLAGQWLPDWHPWEDYRRMYAARADLGGGAIFDTHELDYLSWLVGPVCEFCGFKARSGALDINTEDIAACVLRFSNGALGVLLTDYIQRVPCRRYHVSGSEGTLEWDHVDDHVVLHLPGKRDVERVDVHLTDINDMYVSQARRVLDDLHHGGKPETPVTSMLRVLDLQTRWHAQRHEAVEP